MNVNIYCFTAKVMIMKLVFLIIPLNSSGQTQEITLNDLSAFQEPGRSWQIAGNVYADLIEPNQLQIEKGNGILVNDPTRRAGKDLITRKKYSDIDLELDYMMARGSNSGIYFMGQYELQLKDSWGISIVTSGENGGIYERWDKSKPQGQKGYQGYPPHQKCCTILLCSSQMSQKPFTLLRLQNQVIIPLFVLIRAIIL